MTTKDTKLIWEIAARAAKIAKCDPLDIGLDLIACIEGGCPLRLEDMLGADDFNLMHDVYGINAYLNHETHKLEGGFWPRFAK